MFNEVDYIFVSECTTFLLNTHTRAHTHARTQHTHARTHTHAHRQARTNANIVEKSQNRGWGAKGTLTIKKGLGVLPGARDPYHFPDTIQTHFQTKVKRISTHCRQTIYEYICSFAQSVKLTRIYLHIIKYNKNHTISKLTKVYTMSNFYQMRLGPASVSQLDALSIGYQEVAGSTPAGSATFIRGDLPLALHIINNKMAF